MADDAPASRRAVEPGRDRAHVARRRHLSLLRVRIAFSDRHGIEPIRLDATRWAGLGRRR